MHGNYVTELRAGWSAIKRKSNYVESEVKLLHSVLLKVRSVLSYTSLAEPGVTLLELLEIGLPELGVTLLGFLANCRAGSGNILFGLLVICLAESSYSTQVSCHLSCRARSYSTWVSWVTCNLS